MTTGKKLVDEIRAGRATPPPGIATLGLDVTHRWITVQEPGVTTFVWTVDPAYSNLEGAVICSWLIALADQALFFASNSLCNEGESTRMRSLRFEQSANITGGDVTIAARIVDREGAAMTGRCEFELEDGSVAATVDAYILIVD